MNARTLAGLAVSFTAAAAPAQSADVATIQLPAHVVLTGTLTADVDRDGLDDLVLACRDTTAERRELRVHLRRSAEPRFANTPSLPPYPIETDVVAFTFADRTGAKGRELVLFTAERAVAVELTADGAPKYVPLFAHDLVWPCADADFVLPLPDACVDVDGDGADDLLLPQTTGALVNPHQGPPVTLRLPPWQSPVPVTGRGPATMQGGEIGLTLQLGGGSGPGAAEKQDGGPLVRIRTRTPPCTLLDVDGNGRPDLVAVRNGRLFERLQTDAAVFVDRERALPLPGDRLSLFDPAFDVQLVDVDGDRRLDLVLTTSASRDEEIEVRIDLFVAGENGGFRDKPASRLRLQTIARPPQLVDVDGDGRLDVVAVTVRTDTLRGLTGDGPTALDAQWNVFRNDGRRFVLPAMAIQPLRLPAKAQRGGGTFVETLAGASGRPGALLLRDGDTLQRRPVLRDGDRLQLGEPSTSFAIPEKSLLEGRQSGEVLVRSEHELLHVRTR